MVLSASGICKSYGEQEVLRGVSLALGGRDKMALVGRNGAGKTTLLRILAGLEEPDAGVVARAGRTSITFRPQEYAVDEESTIFGEMLRAWGDLEAIERELEIVSEQLAQDPTNKAITDRYGDLVHRFDAVGGHRWRFESERILAGLGLAGLGDAPVKRMSGGEKTKLSLAKLLAGDYDLLILDEPSNHLDIDATLWLEEFLVEYQKAVLIVSHDRALLNAVVDKVAEIDNGRLSLYNGNIDFYVQERELRRDQGRAAYERREALVKKELEFIRRNIEGQKTKLAQSRRKMLDRLAPVDRVVDHRAFSFPITSRSRSGELVIRTEQLSQEFDQRRIFGNLNFEVLRGEKVGIVGPNGCGKTTLLRILASKATPTSGSFRIGNSVDLAFFDQEHSDFSPTQSPYDVVSKTIANPTEQGIRDVLGAFGFGGLAIEKHISALSGGEKTRLSLLRIVLGGSNLILLDEPTNHLDLESIESLKASLLTYDGTLLLVSHDRDFLTSVCDRFLVFMPEPRLLYGTLAFQDYLASRRKTMGMAERAKRDPTADRDEGYRRKRQTANELKKKMRVLEELEKEALALEDRKSGLEDEMVANAGDYRKGAELGVQHRKIVDSIEELLERMVETEREIANIGNRSANENENSLDI